MNLQFYSQDTNCSSIVSFHPWESNCIALQTTYTLGPVFIRTSGTFLALYWQWSTAHSTSRQANITNHLLPSDGSSPASACLASNHIHLLPYLSFSSLSQKRAARLIRHQTPDSALECAVCMWNICFVRTDRCRRPDVCWDLWSCRQLYECLVWTKSPQQSSGWTAWAACCILQALTVGCMFMKLFKAWVQIY